MGRNAAGESFLRGFLAHSRSSEFFAVVMNPPMARCSRRRARIRPQGTGAGDRLARASGRWRVVARYFIPDPDLGRFAWQRAMHGDGAWSLSGITHTLSSHWAMDAVIDLLTAPVQPWDALICTSRAGRRVVAELLQGKPIICATASRPDASSCPNCQLIPLGIHTHDFASRPRSG